VDETVVFTPFSLTLQGGDRRSIGNANRVAAIILRQPDRVAELMACLWSDDPIVRMRAADAAEKVSAKQPAFLAPFKTELLALADEPAQAELRWHLGSDDSPVAPRTPGTRASRRRHQGFPR
jgi:hypothetical protein